MAPPAGFEPALPPPEGGALSPELRGPASSEPRLGNGPKGNVPACGCLPTHCGTGDHLRRSILDPCRAVGGARTPRGRLGSSCCLYSPAASAKLRPRQPHSEARRLHGMRLGTPSPTSRLLAWRRNLWAATRIRTSLISASPWMARQWRSRRTSESTGFAPFRRRCIPTTALGRCGWRVAKSTASRSDNSLPSGESVSMIIAFGSACRGLVVTVDGRVSSAPDEVRLAESRTIDISASS
jgi:hypothetical protein